ncbi:MAG TPA: response regulator [Ktedonobacterales bacterium]|nr:response regulator [Ktedonobacterales bacterium]
MVRVLIVDDDTDTRDVLRLIVEDAGYDAVTEATDGLETLAALRAGDVPEVVLLDLDLPRLDGLGVLNAVAADPTLAARYAFILLTALHQSRYQAATEICARLSVPLVLKPFNVDTLLDAVATAARRLSAVK